MPKKVGIPRSLFFYRYYPLWKAFFDEIGVEIVISGKTTKKTLDEGVKLCVDEACLPVKLFHGHVNSIKDRVDYLFIPRFTSISKGEYICPKFGGLPDMVRHSIRDLPEIINTEINLRNSPSNAVRTILEIGSYFCGSGDKIKSAYKKALAVFRRYEDMLRCGILPSDILDKFERNFIPIPGMQNSGCSLKIAVIGHVYNLYDSYVNMNMFNKLKKAGVETITIDMLDEQIINEKSSMLPKKIFWNFGRKAVGGAMHLIERKDIDGIIYLMSFGCGVDSFICDLTERKVRHCGNMPFTVITIDEHSGEAGLDTRLEAFTDMIRWRAANEVDISSYGQHIYNS